jgi:hypothetical protein
LFPRKNSKLRFLFVILPFRVPSGTRGGHSKRLFRLFLVRQKAWGRVLRNAKKVALKVE